MIRAQSLDKVAIIISDVYRCKWVYKSNMFNGQSTVRLYSYEYILPIAN